jgi:tetratricopeptide (TPR) repeat protein
MKPYKSVRNLASVAPLIAALVVSSGIFVPSYSAETGSVDNHANPHLKQGIELYKTGNYRESMTEFSMALNSEFDNAILHYYMANALIGMKQRDSAIREFRIAYALAPKKEAGTLSRLALSYMGADNYEDGVAKPVEKSKKGDTAKEPPVDPVFEKTLQMLRKQAEDAGLGGKVVTPQEAEVNRILDENIKKSKAAVVDAIFKANPEDVHLPGEALEHMRRVMRLSDEKMRRSGLSAHKTGAIKDSADSLQSLLQEKNSKSAPRLVPHGTNLYIRN